MHARDTHYYLAKSDTEYAACLSMPEAQEQPAPARGLPLIYAERAQTIIGWLSLYWEADGIPIVGTLVIAQGLSTGHFVAFRLMQTLEDFLLRFGIETYLIPLKNDDPPTWHRAMVRICGPGVSSPHEQQWYVRRLRATVLSR